MNIILSIVKGINLSAHALLFVVRPSFAAYGSEVREVNKTQGALVWSFFSWGVRLEHDITKELLVLRGLVHHKCAEIVCKS